jgi:hypothetical protein
MMHQHFQIQVNNAIAAQMILHEYDFVCGGTKLNLHGSDRLLHLALLLKSYECPLIVERTPYDVGLAESRRIAVLNQLADLGIVVPPERVVIGVSPAIPLRGVEAELIYRNILKQSENGGYQQGQGSGTNGSATGPLVPR